jgi:hypothetical protein
MRKRLTMAIAAGALVAAMVPGVASATGNNLVVVPCAATDGILNYYENYPHPQKLALGWENKAIIRLSKGCFEE